MYLLLLTLKLIYCDKRSYGKQYIFSKSTINSDHFASKSGEII